MSFILAIDQGTTSTRSIIFDEKLKLISTAQEEFTQHFPQSGWVEHNPQDLLSTTIDTCISALNQKSINPNKIAAIGIT
jgi:Glycerol kinase